MDEAVDRDSHRVVFIGIKVPRVRDESFYPVMLDLMRGSIQGRFRH